MATTNHSHRVPREAQRLQESVLVQGSSPKGSPKDPPRDPPSHWSSPGEAVCLLCQPAYMGSWCCLWAALALWDSALGRQRNWQKHSSFDTLALQCWILHSECKGCILIACVEQNERSVWMMDSRNVHSLMTGQRSPEHRSEKVSRRPAKVELYQWRMCKVLNELRILQPLWQGLPAILF